MHNITKKFFDELLANSTSIDAGGLLDYLVSGSEPLDWGDNVFDSQSYAKKFLPKLYSKYGSLLESNKLLNPDENRDRNSDSVSLADLIHQNQT